MAKRYKCAKCGFAWSPKTDELPRRCPYCGKTEYFDMASADSRFSDVEDLLK